VQSKIEAVFGPAPIRQPAKGDRGHDPTPLYEVDPSNFRQQKALGSHGYRFLRLNLFWALQTATAHALVEQAKEQTDGLANGDLRLCSVGRVLKSIDDFRNMNRRRITAFGQCRQPPLIQIP
jgi:hypothetical protein